MSTGDNIVPLGTFRMASLSTIAMIMFMGTSPSGTGGGVQTTTMSAVLVFMVCKLGYKLDIIIGKHSIPTFRIDTALTDIIFYGIILFCGTYAITFTKKLSFKHILVETSSAIGTVGLTIGITPIVSDAGKIILTILMYIGRVGVLLC